MKEVEREIAVNNDLFELYLSRKMELLAECTLASAEERRINLKNIGHQRHS